ncbi:MAG: VWA domain-containing protein [Candidatus Omnitrophica bacterium]|nr:VWA domain-containing protein [Candidatus Omnitrophota bacterium]
MNWANPYWFNGLWLFPALLLIFFFGGRKRRKDLARFMSASLWGRLVAVDFARQRLKKILVFGAVLLLVLALARPQKKGEWVKVERKGIDLMITLDTSMSMLAQDYKPNRFAKAKREITSLLRYLKGDRVGIVAFSGVSFLQCPLTLDYRAARLFTEAMEINMLPRPGTAIGDAIRTAIRGLDAYGPQKKVILLITDGEDHESRPLEAAEQAQALGIKIYCIGIGKPEGEPIPVLSAEGRDAGRKITGYKKDESGEVILSRIGEKTLQEIALKTGGAYYRATSAELELERIYKEIEGLEKGKFEEDYVTKYEDRFFYLLWIAFLLLCVEMMIGERGKENIVGVTPRGYPSVGAGFKPAPTLQSGQARGPAPTLPFLLLVTISCFLIAWKSPVEHRNAKGNELYKQRNYAEALRVYQDAQSDAPEKPELNYNVGNAWYQQKQYDQARESYQQSLTAADTHFRANVYYNLASAEFRKSNLKESLRLFEKALELNPKDEDTRYNIELIKKLLQQQPPPPEEKQKEQQQDQKHDQGGGQAEQKDEGRGTKDEEKQEKKQESETKDQQQKQKQEEESQQDPQESKQEQQQGDAQQEQSGEQQQQGWQGQQQEQREQPAQGSMNQQDAERILDALEEKPDEVGKLLRGYQHAKPTEIPPGKDW